MYTFMLALLLLACCSHQFGGRRAWRTCCWRCAAFCASFSNVLLFC